MTVNTPARATGWLLRRSIVALSLLLAGGQASGHDVIDYLDHAERQILDQGAAAVAELSQPQSLQAAVVERSLAAREHMLDGALVVPAIAKSGARSRRARLNDS